MVPKEYRPKEKRMSARRRRKVMGFRMSVALCSASSADSSRNSAKSGGYDGLSMQPMRFKKRCSSCPKLDNATNSPAPIAKVTSGRAVTSTLPRACDLRMSCSLTSAVCMTDLLDAELRRGRRIGALDSEERQESEISGVNEWVSG